MKDSILKLLESFGSLLVLALIVYGIYIIINSLNNWLNPTKPLSKNHAKEKPQHTNNNYRAMYEPRFLMTINEKYQYHTIKRWATERNLIVFTKIRVLDLINPRNNISNSQVALWKIQAKHVDFVVCDQDINVKCIIEINDNSHNRGDRMERDQFLKEVLEACGYSVIQTLSISEGILDEACGFNPAK